MRYETAKSTGRPATTTLDSEVRAPGGPVSGEVLPPVSLLTVQFLAWIAAAPRTHADVMDAWRSTCPRQSVWEDSLIDGLVAFAGETKSVMLTARGKAVLDASAQPDTGCH